MPTSELSNANQLADQVHKIINHKVINELIKLIQIDEHEKSERVSNIKMTKVEILAEMICEREEFWTRAGITDSDTDGSSVCATYQTL